MAKMFKNYYIFESYEYIECDFVYLLNSIHSQSTVSTQKPRLKVACNC